MGKKGKSEITDQFITDADWAIKKGALEGTVPDHLLDNPKEFCDGYKITIHGQVLNKKGKELKYYFIRGDRNLPYIGLYQGTGSEGKKKRKYYNILSLMSEHYGKYIAGYHQTQHDKNKGETFFLVPKNTDVPDPYASTNLHYVAQKNIHQQFRTKQIIKTLLLYSKGERSDEKIGKMMDVTPGRVYRIRTELQLLDPFKDLRALGIRAISKENIPVYASLLACKGQKSNLTLAKELRPEVDYALDKIQKDAKCDKIVRARRDLVNKGLIEPYNTYGQAKNIAEVREELIQALDENHELPKKKRKKIHEIAAEFGLKTRQVQDWIHRENKKMKKKENIPPQEESTQEEAI